MICFFHSADLDGHASGAIVKHVFPDCEMYGINYGQDFPWEKIVPGKTVFMVDFSLQPFDQMVNLNSLCDLVWIDHHKTALDDAEKAGFKCSGLRRMGVGACELTWEYLFSDTAIENPVPIAIHLLSQYDIFDHSDLRTLPFQYGFRMFPDTNPDNQLLWRRFFDRNHVLQYQNVSQTIEKGELILQYEESQNIKCCQGYSFETVLFDSTVPFGQPTSFSPKKAVCINRGFTNSKIFDSVYDPEKHDLMITFCRLPLPKRKWTLSFYSTKEDVDCGAIAKVFGGGGHRGAAGCQMDELPFDH